MRAYDPRVRTLERRQAVPVQRDVLVRIPGPRDPSAEAYRSIVIVSWAVFWIGMIWLALTWR